MDFVLSPNGLSMDEGKVQTIKDWSIPRWVKDVQSFLGFANFYQKFIHNYLDLIQPLTRLTWKNEAWHWGLLSQLAFNTLKEAFTSASILKHWDPNTSLILEMDTLYVALAVILSICTRGDIYPIVFYLRSFQGAELNYDVYNKELLAIVESFKKWHHYLEGPSILVEVFTNHKNFIHFCGTKVLTHRQTRWLEFLSQFNLKIKFWPRRLGKKPDTLTHHWDVYEDMDPTSQSNYRPLFSHTQLGNYSAKPNQPTPHLLIATVIDLVGLLVDIKEVLSQDPKSMVYANIDSNPCWSLQPDGFLYYKGQKYVPNYDHLWLWVLKAKHDHILVGHPGQNKTYQLIHCDFNWSELWEFVNNYVSSCSVCFQNKVKHHKPYGLLKQLPIPL